MNTLEIVFGYSCYHTMRESGISKNILMMNVLFNVGDLSNIDACKIKIPNQLCMEDKNSNFKQEYNIIIDNIKQKNKIRIWTGRNDIYSYLIMLYVCSIIKKYDYELYVVYSDDYNKDYPSPSVMRKEELKQLSKLEYKLTNQDINNNANIWENLLHKNSDLRIIKNGCVESVSIDYYDSFILNTLEKMGKIKMAQLVAKLMMDVYLHDIMYVYLIERLIEDGKINITIDNSIRYFENLIEVAK